MNVAEAKQLAQFYIDDHLVFLACGSREYEFGFYFPPDIQKHQHTGDIEDLFVGSCETLVNRLTAEVHELGFTFHVDYWLEAYQWRLHAPILSARNPRHRGSTARQPGPGMQKKIPYLLFLVLLVLFFSTTPP